jgi:hypothetical protein
MPTTADPGTMESPSEPDSSGDAAEPLGVGSGAAANWSPSPPVAAGRRVEVGSVRGAPVVDRVDVADADTDPGDRRRGLVVVRSGRTDSEGRSVGGGVGGGGVVGVVDVVDADSAVPPTDCWLVRKAVVRDGISETR